jgi:hypothetical protein
MYVNNPSDGENCGLVYFHQGDTVASHPVAELDKELRGRAKIEKTTWNSV